MTDYHHDACPLCAARKIKVALVCQPCHRVLEGQGVRTNRAVGRFLLELRELGMTWAEFQAVWVDLPF